MSDLKLSQCFEFVQWIMVVVWGSLMVVATVVNMHLYGCKVVLTREPLWVCRVVWGMIVLGSAAMYLGTLKVALSDGEENSDGNEQ